MSGGAEEDEKFRHRGHTEHPEKRQQCPFLHLRPPAFICGSFFCLFSEAFIFVRDSQDTTSCQNIFLFSVTYFIAAFPASRIGRITARIKKPIITAKNKINTGSTSDANRREAISTWRS